MDQTLYTRPASIDAVKIHDSFFSRLMQTTVEKLIPYQWEALNDRLADTEPSYCIRNFKAAAGLTDASHGGKVFQDSDLAKWIECAAFSLMWHKDADLERRLDETIALIGQAQQPDGYLDTYYILNGLDKRFTDMMNNHELYCAGHMLEAATAYYHATGKRTLLEIMIRFVDYIDSVIGPEEGKKHGYPGHEVLEMALIKLYEITGDEKHLRLAKYLIDQRGQSPLYFEAEYKKYGNPYHWEKTGMGMKYYQADRPVRSQDKAQGHAVRAGYLYSGMADVARETGDETLVEACRKIWDNITHRQMYITGAIGQSKTGEAFSYDYDLPNALVYGETCAAISLAFFAQRMLRLQPRGEYGDVLERTLYNGTISGMSLDGQRFFYVNPLEVDPQRCEQNEQFRHVKPQRQKWFSCACCPPNLGRLITSLPGYVYHTRGNTAFAVLYTTNDAQLALSGGTLTIKTETRYPWDGVVTMHIENAFDGAQIALRIPGWCKGYALRVNGVAKLLQPMDGFIYLGVAQEDEIVLTLDMPVQVVRANPMVQDDIGKIAVTRGPVVYCLEQPDNGKQLQRVFLRADAHFETQWEPQLLGGVCTIRCMGDRLCFDDWAPDELYGTGAPQYRLQPLTLIPYYAWANRGLSEMTVWIHERLG